MVNFPCATAPRIQPLISISAYFSTVSQMCLLMGLVFQLPVVMFLLSMADWCRRRRSSGSGATPS
jgi:Sec-independent protein secretion pathway component TatC